MNNINKKSSWDATGISAFLEEAVIPVRIAVPDGEYPMICSVWFLHDAARGELLCVSHKDSRLIKLLTRHPHCGFEIAPNAPPYKGVRGKADISLDPRQARLTLERLIARYLGDGNQSLANWLLSRADDEIVIRLKPVSITSWDYSNRMDG